MDINIRKPIVLAAGCMTIFGLLCAGPRTAQASAADTQSSPTIAHEGDKGDTTIIIKPPIIKKDPPK